MKVIKYPLQDAILIEPSVFGDERGFFKETWHRQRYRDIGIPEEFVQDNISFSEKGVLRGIHFQNPQPQGKLIQVLQGAVFDVAVDIRFGSPTFGRWHGENLSASNHFQFYVPEGFAHGFCVVSDTALVAYKCTDFYSTDLEWTLCWDDPDLAIDWPIEYPTLSKKDSEGMRLHQFPENNLPRFVKQE